ncbi:MAG: hypothetical protein WA825_01150 [Steroidobacteraceae bacterium]
MLGNSARWWKVPAAALLCLLPVSGVAVAQGGAPAAQSSAPAAQFSLDAATLQRYVGHYRVGATDTQSVMTVALSGTQLTMQPTGGPQLEIDPQSATNFSLKGLPVSLDFVVAGKGPATAMIVHQGGQDVTMPRIDDAAAAQFTAKLAARIQSKTALPGSQAAVNDFLDRLGKGVPLDYSKMSPPLAEAMRAQADQAAAAISSLGALQSLTFQGAEANGADAYLAKFLTGSLVVHIVLDSKGMINGLGLTPAAP